MNIILDTNVVLDVLANREPFAGQSEGVLNLAATGQICAAITANTVTDIAYLLRKYLDMSAIKETLLGLMELLDVLSISREQCLGAFDLPMSDFEDALLAVCAAQYGAEYIVTRNTKDFTASPVKAIMPGELLKIFQ